MTFSSINIQGNIVSSEILDKIRSEEKYKFQQPEAFGLARTASLRDEIGMAWSIMRTHWQAYKKRLDTLPKGDTGTSLTREKLILPLLTELGYEVTIQRAQQVGGKPYAISHGASNKDLFPIHVMGYNDHLDKRRDNNGPRLSPHALVQEYLNNTEHLYALVTNGRQLRLLRDATRLVRMSYLEFDLERMFEEELYADFSMLYRVLHASRMPEKVDMGAESVIEYYHQESMASGTRIREKLSEAVEDSIKTLANGFLAHPKNKSLVALFENHQQKPETYYMHQLRLIYRMLFLIVLEERKLVYPDNLSEDQQRLRTIYYNYYSIERLRKLTENRVYVDADKYDLWESLKTTFLLFEEEQYGSKLGIKPLGSGLFASDALGTLKDLFLKNGDLIEVLKRLTTFVGDQGQLVRVNYSDLDVEEFGSVYEGLLEYDPVVEKIGAQWEFSFVAGEGRSSSGSHYTPEELVKPLIKHSLDYIIEEKLQMANRESQIANGEQPFAIYQLPITNLITNLIVENEIVSGLDNLGNRNGDSHKSISINQLFSQRRIVWDDFATPKGIDIGSGQYSRGLGTKQQQRVQSLLADSQRKSERSGDTSDVGSKGAIMLAGKNSGDYGKIQYTWKTNSQLPTLALSQNQIKTIWQILPQTIRHSLLANYQLLSITVCDVACGSGHILLSAARKIATELASLREGAEQPSPTYYRAALRDVIRHCIYGVDLNPLAVELTKVALWIEAHNPGEPLNFLDHHIKCGNAIVGLAHRDELDRGIAAEAFKTLPGDDKAVAKTVRDKNTKELKERKAKEVQLKAEFEKTTTHSVQEAMAEYRTFNQLPETTPEEIKAKQKAYKKFIDGKGYTFLKAMADVQVAQFFIPKIKENQQRLMTDGEYRLILSGWQGWQDPKVAYATVVAQEKHFFHWFLEFPEVFNKGGFDCILGNPPFLGGQKLTGTYGNDFAEYIKHNYAPIGSVDLVTYFFRRIFTIIKQGGFQSLISTNTIAQGDARLGGLVQILQNNGVINHGVRSMKWPGLAAVEVALVTIFKGHWNGKFVLDQKEVSQITSYLDDSEPLGDPYPLKANEGKSFQGSIVLGKGFVITPEEAQKLIAKDPKNKDVLYPYLNGDDLNNQVDQSPTRWVINFKDWPLRRYTPEEWENLSPIQQEEIENKLEKGSAIEMAPPYYEDEVAADYPDCLEIVERDVKPERQRWKIDSQGKEIIGTYALRKPLPERWWHYGEKRPALYSTIAGMERVITVARISKTVAFELIPQRMVFADALVIFPYQDFNVFGLLQSTLNVSWAWNYCTTMKSDLNYSPGNTFDTLPFPELNNDGILSIGDRYQTKRKQLMELVFLGLTRIYNFFHANEIQSTVDTNDLEGKNNTEIERQYGKEVWNLWNHLQKTEGTCSWEEAVKGIVELRQLHKQMDEAVLEAYGWGNAANGEQQMANGNKLLDTHHSPLAIYHSPINLRHDFYEVDYLPENDRVRYTIHPEARKEVLKRLLLLNHERYEEEILQGLHKKEDAEKFYAEKGKKLPAEVAKIYAKGYTVSNKKTAKVQEAQIEYKKQGITQTALAFDIPQETKTDIKVTLQKQDGTMLNYHIRDKAKQIAKNYAHLEPNLPLAEIIKAQSKGGKFQFEGVWYMVVEKM